jgi:beta-galactosidase
MQYDTLPLVNYSIENQRLYIDGEPLSFFSGSFQYWRVEPALWAQILERVKGMGFGVIETYMPWSVHETAPGRFDFGKTDRRRDLSGFLGACHSAHVKVLARPGPHINAEMTYFGYPERLFADEELMARCADGTMTLLPAPPRMFPVPCYHHPRFQAEVKTYFDALAEAMGGSGALYPDGPVIAIQADNECSKFMRANPFDWDYSEYAVRLYRKWLQDRYGTLDELGRVHRRAYQAWQLVDPPRRMSASKREDLPRFMDWAEFGEYYINKAVSDMAAMLRALFGEGVPLFHNYPVTLPVPPLDMTGAEGFLDFQGVDSYPQRTAYHGVRTGVKYTSAMSRLPVMAEFSSGSVYYALPLALEDQTFTTWSILMHGIKGVNFYMIVERERWYGSPVKRDGSIRERHYEFYRQLLAEVREWGLEEMSCERPVLLLLNREYERLANASTVLSPNSRLVPQFFGMFERPADMLISDEEHGLREAVAARYSRLLAFWYWALTAAHAHFAIGDTSASEEVLSRYGMVVVPTFEFMDEEVQQRLVDYANAGGTLVVGPRAPEADSNMEPSDILGRHMREALETRVGAEVFGVPVEEMALYGGEEDEGSSFTYRSALGAGWLVHVGLVPRAMCGAMEAEPFAPMVDTMLRAGGIEPAFVPSDPRVDTAIWSGAGRTLLFIANPTDCRIETSVSHTGGLTLKDMRTGQTCSGDGVLDVALEPYTILVLGTG